MSLTDEIRAGATRVADQARHVRINHDAIPAYAQTLGGSPPAPDIEGDEETRAAFSLQLNAINFGSGWFPTLNKPQGLSGFRTMEAGLKRRGPWTSEELRALTRQEIAETFGQDPEHELMGHFERHLNELGERVDSFAPFARAKSVIGLAEELASWPTWYDRSPYGHDDVPFFKRAQIAAAD